MNIEKAIEYFKQRVEHIEEYLGTYGDVYGDYDLTAEEEKALEALGNEKLVNYKATISALEKQLPKPPEHKVHEKYKALGRNYYCSCGVMFIDFERNGTNYCGNCGAEIEGGAR